MTGRRQWYRGSMCSARHAPAEREQNLPECTVWLPRGTGSSGASNQSSRNLVLRDGHAATPPRAVRSLRREGQATQLHQQFPEPAAVFQIHFHKLESHGLRPRASDDRLYLDVAHTVRDLESQERTRRKMTLAGAHATAQIQFRDRKPEILAHIHRSGHQVAPQL